MSPPEECPAGETDDAAVVAVVLFVRRCLLAADVTEPQEVGVFRVSRLVFGRHVYVHVVVVTQGVIHVEVFIVKSLEQFILQ